MMMDVRAFRPEDESSVILLWEQCDLLRPWNVPYKDIQRKLLVNPELFLVGVLDEKLIGTVMAGYEGHRGWLNYLAVNPEYQRQGYATALVREVESLLANAGCPKINLQIRASNQAVIDFYHQLGYQVDDAISMGKRLDRDN